MSATGGLGKQVHCLAMSCCDLAMDEGLLTDPQTMTLSISDLLCGAQETYFGSFRVRIQAPLPGQSDNKPLSDLEGPQNSGLLRFDFANCTNATIFWVASRAFVPLSASLLHSPNNIILFCLFEAAAWQASATKTCSSSYQPDHALTASLTQDHA